MGEEDYKPWSIRHERGKTYIWLTHSPLPPGRANQGAGRAEGGYPAGAAAFDLWRKANVSFGTRKGM